jgi:hypothetical protein
MSSGADVAASWVPTSKDTASHDILCRKQESWMSKRALEFVETWVSEQIFPEGFPPMVDVSRAKALETSCRAAANAAGISDAEIGEQFDNLTTFIAGQIQEAVGKLSAKDD